MYEDASDYVDGYAPPTRLERTRDQSMIGLWLHRHLMLDSKNNKGRINGRRRVRRYRKAVRG